MRNETIRLLKHPRRPARVDLILIVMMMTTTRLPGVSFRLVPHVKRQQSFKEGKRGEKDACHDDRRTQTEQRNSLEGTIHTHCINTTIERSLKKARTVVNVERVLNKAASPAA